MNRALLDQLGVIAADYYYDALERHPGLLLDPTVAVTDEDLTVWRVLMLLDEVFVAITAAQHFDDATRADEHVVAEVEDLPF